MKALLRLFGVDALVLALVNSVNSLKLLVYGALSY
jgi:hypothetical protein